MSESEMVVRVARAMFRNVGFGDCDDGEMERDGVWDEWWPKRRDYYIALARAAIEALTDSPSS